MTLNLTVKLDPTQYAGIIALLKAQATTLDQIASSLVLLATDISAIGSDLSKLITALTIQNAATIHTEFYSAKGERLPMPLVMSDNFVDSFFIIGTDAAGLQGAALAEGQTINVVSADPQTVLVTMDPAPAKSPTGVQSVASGTVKSATPPTQPNVAINLTATVLNADGTTAETVTDTVTITPGTAVAIGEVFGAATPLTSAPTGPAAPKA